ncbi:alpha-glucan family phosphorylase [Microbacterium sp. Marseille-Q6965]|uniref:alpha-glucan family phosphorylase n=1 Tax=Microbacterium sp. Marseille-Q6965 TaxID=2965072 RepID=UPI0021B76700|nr:alpha-glucan family phosphorylase [Microbacterium sp. Marseille-Q6965]
MRAIRRFTVRPVLPEPLAALGELAGNLRWCWDRETQDVFAHVDAGLWETTQDPVRVLGGVAAERLDELASDPAFLQRLDRVRADLRAALADDLWYQREVTGGPRAIAYFSPEFGIAAALPQYSGGLGILAGDHLKAASDLGVPAVGVGLLYRHGYFTQSLSREGWQQESYPVLDPDELPLTPLREADGAPAMVSLAMPGGPELRARIWVARVGRVPLLLLDSAVDANPQNYADITDRLYGGGGEHRLRQELLLGVGGVRALRVFTRLTGAPEPEVYHTNEGHAGFQGLERIRELTAGRAGLGFDEALEMSRASTVFTTHTPVPAGIDRFPRALIEQYFATEGGVLEGVPVDRVLALGAEDHDGGDPGVFNMAVMGFRLGQRANGVSRLHGRVSRTMFNGLWPDFDEGEVPIGSITNGVHAPTWMAREFRDLLSETGAALDGDGDDLARAFDAVGFARIWSAKRRMRERLVHDARDRVRRSWLRRGAVEAELGWIDDALSPDVLTIGFARRVPSYKRLTLMLRDPQRLKALLLDANRPIQLVIAGKAHPADDGGKALIQQLVRFADDPDVRHRIVFLPDYGIQMAQRLYPGCDVWLNNPLRPYEACGTSGMKAALNGGLNLSILDGWWDEWFDGQNGWAIPSADGVDEPDKRDDLEASALYELLERDIAPRFYDRDADGVPVRWMEMMRHTLASLGPKVLASRMVRDYVGALYVPAAAAARALNEDDAGAVELAAWKRRVREAWPGVRVEHVESSGVDEVAEVGAPLAVTAYAALGGLAPGDVEVQLVYGRAGADDQLTALQVAPLAVREEYEGGRASFAGEVRLDHAGPFGYTVRIVPRHPLLATTTELGLAALA